MFRTKSFFSAPKEVYDAVPDIKERFRGAHIIGWIIIVFALLIFLGAFILGAWNGIHNNFNFIEFFIRFLIMLYGMETFDIVFFDWVLSVILISFRIFILKLKIL